jgi:hypothetical protein
MSSLPEIPKKNKYLISNGILFFRRIIIPIFLTLSLFWLYVKCFCFFSSTSSDADFVCSLNWKDGLFLVTSYSIVKSVSILLGFDTIFKRLLVTLLLYSFSFALIAFPFWIASFFQPLIVNSFLHVLFIILTIEMIFDTKIKSG